MCGFVGVVSHGTVVDVALVEQMRDRLVHRGPDGAGTWTGADGRVVLGHRRLAVIDVAHGAQPLASRDGTLVVAYNGEIYNHQTLRRELERLGWRFTTRCDTEVLVAAYEAWGEACLERLDGMFAFVLWDEPRRTLFFARDRLGKKPLYHARTREGWAFASEIKALLAHPDAPRAVDPVGLAHYLSFLVAPAPGTLFAGIEKLPAGHCGTWNAIDGISVRRWWAPSGESRELSLPEAGERVREVFVSAVEKRLMSDVPFGVYLSGGLDSSANVAVMARLVADPIRTFSVAFADEPGLDELAHARAVAKEFSTTHREIVLDDAAVLASLPALVHHQDEPIADPVCVPLLHLARLTKSEGVTVVQIGEGSDEIFLGYSIYARVLRFASGLRRATAIVPLPALRGAAAALRPFVGGLQGEFVTEALRRGIPPAHGIAGLAERDKAMILRGSSGYSTAHDYLYERFGSGWSDDEVARVSRDHELQLRLSELLLMRVDKMTMAASVEARAPYLDHELVELALGLPLPVLFRDGTGKLALRRALEGLVPDAVLSRRKQGFGAPVWRWLDALGPRVEDELVRAPVSEHLDPMVVRAFLHGPRTPRRAFELWTLLNFALWHRHWIEGEDLRDARPLAAGIAA